MKVFSLVLVLSCLAFATNLAGQPLLSHSVNYDSGQDDFAGRRCIAVSATITYVAGASYDGNQDDLILWALDQSGSTLWVRTITGPGNQTPTGLALDGSGGVYVAATAYDFGTSSDYLLARYDSSGNQLWLRTEDRGSSDVATAIAVDGSGRIAVTGSSSLSGQQAHTVVWDSSGTRLWGASYSVGVFERGYDIAFSSTGILYLAGTTRPSSTTQRDELFFACYDTAGTELWTDTWGGSGGAFPTRLLLDGSGNCYVSVTARSCVQCAQRAHVLKYDPTGTLQWESSYSVGDPAGGDRAEAMLLHPAGGVYVGVESYSGTDHDVHILSVNSATPQVLVVHDTGGSDEVESMAFDGLGNIVIAGLYTQGATGDGLLLGVTPGGSVAWSLQFDSGTSEDFLEMAVDHAGDIVLFGERGQGNVDLMVVRYGENQPPVATPTSVTGYEDLPAQITLSGTDADNDPLTFHVVSQPAVGSLTGTPPSLTYIPPVDFSGQVSFLFEARDANSSSPAESATITVLPRNDAPSFVIPAQVVTPEGSSAPVTMSTFASSISVGPVNESAQVPAFAVAGLSNSSLFLTTPQVSATGALSFTPTGTAGSCLVTLVLKDDGGTVNGGSDTSAPQSFFLYVGDAPSTGGGGGDDKGGESSCSTTEDAQLLGWFVLMLLLAGIGVRLRGRNAE